MAKEELMVTEAREKNFINLILILPSCFVDSFREILTQLLPEDLQLY